VLNSLIQFLCFNFYKVVPGVTNLVMLCFSHIIPSILCLLIIHYYQFFSFFIVRHLYLAIISANSYQKNLFKHGLPDLQSESLLKQVSAAKIKQKPTIKHQHFQILILLKARQAIIFHILFVKKLALRCVSANKAGVNTGFI
jgi:hypothetical protein